MRLEDLGCTPSIEAHLQSRPSAPLVPGRVSNVAGRRYKVLTGEGELPAALHPSLAKAARSASELPAVGDWVGLKRDDQLNRHNIITLAPRKNKLSRRAAGGRTEEQVIAANIDTVLIVMGLDDDFNVRRVERYLVMVHDMGARPVIVLNKTDRCDQPQTYIDMVAVSAPDVPVVALSALRGDNLEGLAEYIRPGETAVLVGSSGAGKSTLINHLLGYSRQKVGEVRGSDGKGRHVTTTRELILLPRGGMLIDNPGIREIQLWTDGDGLSSAFSDIEDLAAHCRFKDCRHLGEPRCAVRRAVEDGMLSEGRLANYHKLLREEEHARTKRDVHAVKKKGKEFAKMLKYADYKRKGGRRGGDL